LILISDIHLFSPFIPGFSLHIQAFSNNTPNEYYEQEDLGCKLNTINKFFSKSKKKIIGCKREETFLKNTFQ